MRRTCYTFRMNDSALDIDAVIFDMDGLMFDTERLRLEAWQRVARQEGYAIPEYLLIECIGLKTTDSEQLLNAALAPTGFDYRRARGIRGPYMEQIIAERGVPIKPGLDEMLDAIDSLGLARGVATSTLREEALDLLRDTGLLERFGAVVCGDEVQNGKPAPDIFLMTAEKLGADPRRCLVLEDSENGIRAAAAAGCIPIVIPDIKPPGAEVLAIAHRRLDSLGAAAKYLLTSVPKR